MASTSGTKRKGDETDGGSSSPKKSKPAATISKISYEVIEEDYKIEPALTELRGQLLAVKCEGDEISRKGELVILSVATEHKTYLFNIKKLGADVFDKGLRDLLEDSTLQKLMFKCCEDSDCLRHQFKVTLANVLDLQLLESVCLGDHKKHNEMPYKRSFKEFLPKVSSFQNCLRKYCSQETVLIEANRHGTGDIKEPGVWSKQPLKEFLLKYSAAQVQGFFILHREMMSTLNDNESKKVLKEGSLNYLKYFRSIDERTYDKYEMNRKNFLPWLIFTNKGTYSSEYTCNGCKCKFPFREKSKDSKCPVCFVL